MNCQSCTARIDYRFETSCAYCDAKVEASGVPLVDSFPDLQVKKRRAWPAAVINVAYTLASSIAGMISGTVAAYTFAVVTYEIFFSGNSNVNNGCGGFGMVFGMLSMLAGAHLGAVGGAVFSVKRPLCKDAFN